ncbi:condensation domain-containing protein, partial [Candidatus Corynebacterium faecigallinarum]|uniref:condensation domain-containing protein n=1 Tax=Candidatus Corynebacterium faecigallinarum TaxID=2838528 RepID=UPI003FD0E99C
FVTRARRAGHEFTAADVFSARTVGSLAGIADDNAQSDQDRVVLDPVDSSVLLPIAARKAGTPGFAHFTQAFTWTTPQRLGTDDVTRILTDVTDQHPVFSGTLVRDHTGSWSLNTGSTSVDPADSVTVSTRIRTVHTSVPWDSDQWKRQHDDIVTDMSTTLDPEHGILWAATLVTSDTDTTGRLIMVIHHLIVDGVSWRILTDDLTHTWDRYVHGTATPLPTTGTSVTTWAHALAARATDEDVTDQLDYWMAATSGDDPLLGVRGLDQTTDTRDTADAVHIHLDQDTTTAVLTRLPELLTADVNDILLGALTVALGAWQSRRGIDHRNALIGLEGHGREESFVPGADLSRSLGWFTTWYPVSVSTDTVDPTTALTEPTAAADAALRVKEHLAGVPDKGLGYGLLRHLNTTTGSALSDGNAPQIGFNYLGQFTSASPTASATDDNTTWSAAPETGGMSGHSDPDSPLPAVVDINVSATGYAGQLTINGTAAFAAGILTNSDVTELVDLWTQTLRTLATYADQTDTPRLSPSDVLATGTTQEDLDQWTERYGRLRDIYPLSPLQQGLVFHAALTDAGDNSGATGADMYVVQSTLRLSGAADPDRMSTALSMVLRQYPNLTAAIVPDQDGSYTAVLPDHVDFPLDYIDLRTASTYRGQTLGNNVDTATAQVTDIQRTIPFNLAEPPLLRMALVTDGETTGLVLTKHHVLSDGWSTPILLTRILDCCNRPQGQPSPDHTYRDFLTWLDSRNHQDSIDTWSDILSRVDEPTLVGIPGTTATDFPECLDHELTAVLTDRLTTTARDNAVTLSTLVQSAWATTLNAMTGQNTVTFGTTVSGRPTDIDGIEKAVGLFINTLPVPVTFTGNPTCTSVLHQVQGTNTRLLDHHHTPLTDLQKIVGVGDLFDTLVAYENYPVSPDTLAAKNATDGTSGGLSVVEFSGRDSTHYPITIAVLPGDTLRLRITAHPEAI